LLSSSLLLLSLLLLLLSDPLELSPRFFLSELLLRFFPSEPLSSDSLELLSRFFFSELAAPELLARLPRDTSLGLVVEQLSTLLSRATTFGLVVEQLSTLLSRATLAALAARLLAAPLPCATSAGLTSSALLFLAQISVRALETLFFLSLPSLAGVLLAVRSREDIIESEAAKDIAGELSRRRRSPPPDGPAMARPSAALSGLLPAAAGVRTCATFSCFFSAAGGPLGLGVEVVFGPLAAFFFFIPLSSVSTKSISPKQQSDRMKYKSFPPLTLRATTSSM
jgi:hypothetical protein